jgi:hypothetical protein
LDISQYPDFLKIESDVSLIIKSMDLPLFNIVSEYNFPFILNWLCNTKDFLHVHDNTILLCLSSNVCEWLKNNDVSKNVHIVHFHFNENGLNTFYFLHDKLHHNGDLSYYQHVFWRLHLFLSLLKRGHHFVLFESDSVWFASFWQDIYVKSTTSNADIISPKANPHYCNYDNCLSNQFLLFRSSSLSPIFYPIISASLWILNSLYISMT